jgi:hypothetical protein
MIVVLLKHLRTLMLKSGWILLLLAHIADKMYKIIIIFSVIQKHRLVFVRLYFLNCIRYITDLHNILKIRSKIFNYHRLSARPGHSSATASVENRIVTMQNKIFAFIKSVSATAVQHAFRLSLLFTVQAIPSTTGKGSSFLFWNINVRYWIYNFYHPELCY